METTEVGINRQNRHWTIDQRIRHLVDHLYDLLQYDDGQFIKSGIELLLQHVVCQATEFPELSNIEQLVSPKHRVRSKFEDTAVKNALGLKKRR